MVKMVQILVVIMTGWYGTKWYGTRVALGTGWFLVEKERKNGWFILLIWNKVLIG